MTDVYLQQNLIFYDRIDLKICGSSYETSKKKTRNKKIAIDLNTINRRKYILSDPIRVFRHKIMIMHVTVFWLDGQVN